MNSRTLLTASVIIILVVIAAIVFAYWPQPTDDNGDGTPPTGLVSQVKIAYLNPDQTLPNQVKPGDISGCDNVVLKEISIQPTRAPLTAALNALLADKSVWTQNDTIYNYLGQGNLQLQSAAVENGIARIYLMGTRPPLAGVCDDPRLFIQIAQTARQFPTVQTVQIYINGALNTWGQQG